MAGSASSAQDQTVLQVENLHAYYGQSHILHGVSLQVHSGEVVALLGRNGVGKTTTLRAIAGLIPQVQGHIKLAERELTHLPAYQIARQGVVYVPSGRRSFAQLTVRECLQVAVEGRGHRKKKDASEAFDRVFEIFPALKERLHVAAGVLSGGQNQMLKMACAFLANPIILLLDEPTEGLAPLVVKELHNRIAALAQTGVGILLAEQNSKFAFSLSERAYILNKGAVQLSGDVTDLSDSEEALLYLGV
ncbi:ABC transporter ATP-binding protein [Kyrpidia spormannii]|uniref:High-affinity branched-chain amino acid transport ATP-binding protein BraG n=2 Tax=Kyrpidia spormannii TaxID=2055160 RepID=A0ACA8ZCR3_9BACL|nr:ABC transporter ATP-binding protein [Kyrpidia spormannii]CAB3395259.1 High-affinity branched-chain amino acid transport ATP-binding protein BraG [Kyrpidia spormannii]CAB3396056.1 High-affinity branched-chain amino acid transport ATP-binding protein BraG [Kyrpidia spormannii]HHY67824.1 ABC transporter ATP-binding protein [Alicyclobacillus sp.]